MLSTRFRIRLGIRPDSLEPPLDVLRPGAAPPGLFLRAGDAARLEVALLDASGAPLPLNGIAALTLEIKAAATEAVTVNGDTEIHYFAPALTTAPLLQKTLAAAELTAGLTQSAWAAAAPDAAQAVFLLSSDETALAPGRRWLTLSLVPADAPEATRTLAAGEIEVLGGGLSRPALPPAEPPGTAYSRAEAAALFAQRGANLADLADAAAARGNLALGSAATCAVQTALSPSDEELPTGRAVLNFLAAQPTGQVPQLTKGLRVESAATAESPFPETGIQDWDFSITGVYQLDTYAPAGGQLLYETHRAGPNRASLALMATGEVRLTLVDDNEVAVEYDLLPDQALVDGARYTIGVTADRDGVATLYVNGLAQAATVGISGSAGVDLGLGNNEAARVGFAPGRHSSLSVYNGLLSASEMAEIHASGGGRVRNWARQPYIADMEAAFAVKDLTRMERVGFVTPPPGMPRAVNYTSTDDNANVVVTGFPVERFPVRLELFYKSQSGTATPLVHIENIANGVNDRTYSVGDLGPWLTAWQRFVIELPGGVTPRSDFQLKVGGGGSWNLSDPDISFAWRMTGRGCLHHWDFSAGTGYQAHDAAPEFHDLLLPETGWNWLHATAGGQVRARLFDATGDLPLLDGTRPVLPPAATVTGISARNRGPAPVAVEVQLGDLNAHTAITPAQSVAPGAARRIHLDADQPTALRNLRLAAVGNASPIDLTVHWTR